MAESSPIEWTDATWTPIRARVTDAGKTRIGWHCEHVSEGCRNCYAESFNRRLGTGRDFKPGELMRDRPKGKNGDVELFLDAKMLTAPMHWSKPRMIFVCSMTDLFADFVDTDWIDQMYAVMALCPHHTFQVLTKRPERARDYLNSRGRSLLAVQAVARKMRRLKPDQPGGNPPWPLPNVWLGTSVENQATADARIPLLLEAQAATRFISAEPLLGPVDLTRISLPGVLSPFDALFGATWTMQQGRRLFSHPPDHFGKQRLDWVIVGGESGSGARPMHPEWARSLRDQCAATNVAFLFKQWGEWAPYDRSRVDGTALATLYSLDRPLQKFGKKLSGRLLDGVQHNGMPGAANG